MRAMALSDLQAVADRLKSLHKRLQEDTGRKWTQQQIALGADVPLRTYQTWVGAKNENEDGDGYRKITAWYRRKLKDKTITYNWLVWGQQSPPKHTAPITRAAADPYVEQLGRIEEKLDALIDWAAAATNRRAAVATLQAKLEEIAARAGEPAADTEEDRSDPEAKDS